VKLVGSFDIKSQQRTVENTTPIKNKSDDKTEPPTPVLIRAVAFDKAPEGTIPTPQPAPAPSAPRRDPVLIELGNIELGATVQIVSLSDNPEASFKNGDVFELDLTGYDKSSRHGTIILDAEMMKTKGVEGGEQLLLRQVDSNGNASGEINVRIDPNAWANQTMTTPDGRQARGADLAYLAGLTGIDGISHLDLGDKAGVMRSVRALGIADTSAPKLLEKNVSVQTTNWSKGDRELATALLSGQWGQQLGGTLTPETIADYIANPTNSSLTEDTVKLLKKLEDVETFQHFSTAGTGKIVPQLTANTLQEIANNASTSYIHFDMAVEPGSTLSITNNSAKTQTPVALQLGAADRAGSVRIPSLNDGDKVIIEFRDASGVAGKPMSFEYSSKTADGKKAGNSPLNAMLAAMTSDSLAKKLSIDGTEVRQVSGPAVGGAFGTDAWVVGSGSKKIAITGAFAREYEANAAQLGLPKGAAEETAEGLVQQFAKGRMIAYANNGGFAVEPST
jgi:hypothetical protein